MIATENISFVQFANEIRLLILTLFLITMFQGKQMANAGVSIQNNLPDKVDTPDDMFICLCGD
jgi:hypothetical protein